MEAKSNPPVKRGRGRPFGSLSKQSQLLRQAAAATGKMPHEILLSMARGEIQYAEHLDAESGEITKVAYMMDLEGMRDAAGKAAPFYAPKISTVELLKTGGDDELDAIIAELAAEAGVTLGTSGEGEEEGDSGCEDAAPIESGRRRRTFGE